MRMHIPSNEVISYIFYPRSHSYIIRGEWSVKWKKKMLKCSVYSVMIYRWCLFVYELAMICWILLVMAMKNQSVGKLVHMDPFSIQYKQNGPYEWLFDYTVQVMWNRSTCKYILIVVYSCTALAACISNNNNIHWTCVDWYELMLVHMGSIR
jgi:hypothetical protein